MPAPLAERFSPRDVVMHKHRHRGLERSASADKGSYPASKQTVPISGVLATRDILKIETLAEAEPPPPKLEVWKYHSEQPDVNLIMEGQDYNQSSEYDQEFPPSSSSQAGYYPQNQPPQQRQYYAASSSSNTSTGSPTAYQPIYPSVGYAASASGYGPQPGAYEYPSSQRYPHTSASANDTLNENEAELKRLRNTAASARFRAKKKKREQSLERQSREKREELQRLENRISELEQENKFLKSLILTPRSSKTDEEEGEASGKGKEKSHGSGERKGGKGKDGVGTSRH